MTIVRRILALLTALLALPTTAVIGQSGSASPEPMLHFIGITATEAADKQLRAYLLKTVKLQFEAHTMGYNAAVRRLADWNSSECYIAHMTPYAYVAAEMLGADFEILATYWSKATNSTVYHSYFVINRKDFQDFLKTSSKVQNEPSLTDITEYLNARKPARFLYHDKFSTSSYFLPSLYFLSAHVFAMTESAGGSLTPIIADKAPTGQGSSFLIREVAAGRAHLAAVWDDTKNDAKALADQVYFVEYPTAIPNDLLVVSKSLPKETREKIRQALQATREDKTNWGATRNEQNNWSCNATKNASCDDEFQWWVDIADAPDALDALGELRRLAANHSANVTVKVQMSQSSPTTGPRLTDEMRRDILRAVEDGVRLSGTEFVLFREGFHRRRDVIWTLSFTHDGAVVLESQIENVDLKPQRFSISFMDPPDLTTRIAALVQSRMHRIRYVWPYQENYPAVIRDLDFVPEDAVKVQRIIWTDPNRNEYDEGITFDAGLIKTRDDSHKLRLTEGLFPRGQEGFQFEPMSNVAYRVILQRPSGESPLFEALTAALVGALMFAAVGLAWDLRRKQPPPVGLPQTYQRLVEAYHRPWRDRQIREADVLWCDPHIDQFIAKVSSGTPVPEEVEKAKLPWIPISVGGLKQVFHWMFGERLKLALELVHASEVGNAAALDRLIKNLVRSRRLSPFVGRPLEWEALGEIVYRNLRRLNIGQSTNGHTQLYRDPALAGVVSRHFQDVLEEGKDGASFFHDRWELEEQPGGYRMFSQQDLGEHLRPVSAEGVVSSLRLEFDIPSNPQFRDALLAVGSEAWLLGQMLAPTVSGNGTRQLTVQLKPLGVLKGADSSVS